MALSFNQRYTEKPARDKRQYIYGRMDDDLEDYIGEIVGTYVEDIGAAKTMELFVEAAEYPEFHDVTPEEEFLLRSYGLARILTRVLFHLEGTARQEYFETFRAEGKENEAMPLSFVTEQQRVNAIAANKAEEDEIISNLIEGAIVYEHNDADVRGYIDVDDGCIGFGSCLKTQFMLDAGGDGGYAVYNIPIVLKDDDGEIYVTSAFLIPHGSTTGRRVSDETLQTLREWQDMSDNK